MKDYETKIVERLEKAKLIPVIKISDLSKVLPLTEALLKGGLDIAEITFRTKEASEAIKMIRKEFPQVLVGAGTVINPQMAKEAYKAGAQFLVSPGFNPQTVSFAKKHKLSIFPGVASASEIEAALMQDLCILKFFPSEVLGGVKMLKAFAGPFPQVKFIPTGGITKDNAADYLSQKNVVAVGGTWMVKEDLIANQKWEEISALCKAFGN